MENISYQSFNAFDKDQIDLFNNVYNYRTSIESAINALTEQTDIDAGHLDGFKQYDNALYEWIYAQLSFRTITLNNDSWPQWGWNSFLDHADLRIGLLSIYKNKPIPIHDHPGASGVLLVLDGNLSLTEYKLHHHKEMTNIKCVELSCVSQMELGQTDFSLITPDSGNIHSLNTESDVCILLDILLIPYDEAERSWYTPVSQVNTTGEVFSAFSINKK